jgi:hypothetical protein
MTVKRIYEKFMTAGTVLNLNKGRLHLCVKTVWVIKITVNFI